ncbi:hypothetical protein UlMin_026875, partial [Ulmus minor]
MDMYFGSGIDDLMVPNRSDRLPSPDSWSKWGVGASESFPIDNNGIMYDPMFADEEPNLNREGFFSEAEMEDFVHDRYQSSSSSVNGGLSEDSFRRSMLSGQRPDYPLNELASPGQMDDIFLSSLLEDLPGVNNADKSMQSDHFSRDTKFSVENVSSGMQNKGYLTTQGFSPSYALGNDDATTSADQKDYITAKATSTEISVHSEQSCMDSLIDDDTPLEESVLQELKMVMNQFTEKTRICFRDSLYRLANNSKQHDMTSDQDEDLCVEVPHSWTHNTETM